LASRTIQSRETDCKNIGELNVGGQERTLQTDIIAFSSRVITSRIILTSRLERTVVWCTFRRREPNRVS